MSSEPASTRAEHHADSDAETVRDSRRRVRDALQTFAVGRDQAVPGSKLSQHVPLKPTTVRDIIAELRDDPEGPPIGNCSDGYYVLDSREEFEDHVARVNSEIQTKRERLEATVESFERREGVDVEQ